MKKLLGILVLGLLVISSPAKAGAIGEGDLTLKPFVIDWFIKYVGGRQKKPDTFFILNNGESAWYVYCAHGECRPSNAQEDIKWCERKTQKKCKIFARRRTIKWKNGINPGKGKESKFSSKMSKEEVRAKLTKLGFLGGTTSTTTKIEKKESKITKKSKKKTNDNISQQLKDLNDLYKSGALTKEEFEKAKKKLLN